jgi:hypothetical protein
MEENNTSENKEEKKKLAGSNPGPGPTLSERQFC